ncbi:MAG: 30S ribosomal protein S15 [Candidatus Altiarchaeota archaeon]|nr:30S ribosomal protein S15 [Candidatus Altiarchaeota archaeon]
MARIYAHKKGKSGSTKPHRTSVPNWVQYSPKEVESLVLKLAKEGRKPAMIGTILRDSYGVPDVRLITGQKIAKILGNNQLSGEVPADLFDLLIKAVRVREHLNLNKKDVHNKRALSQTEMKIKRLMDYYRKTGAIKKEWKYTPEVARILVSGGR